VGWHLQRVGLYHMPFKHRVCDDIIKRVSLDSCPRSSGDSQLFEVNCLCTDSFLLLSFNFLNKRDELTAASVWWCGRTTVFFLVA
jgi:hypothetical protein